MFDDDDRPAKTNAVITLPRNLETLSIEELEHYITILKSEIERTEGEITRKKASRDAAASIFKS